MRKWVPLLAISLSTFMLLLDVTIVSVAVPSMASALHSSFSALQWTVDLYVLVLAALLMAIGSASDLVGRRRMFLAGLIVFALSSLACGLAPSIGFLIAARGVQGAGGSAMLATNAALIGGHYSGKDRGFAFGVWGAVMGAASAVGPILGGLLTEHISWRSIFLVNLPVAAVAIVLGLRTLAESRNHGKSAVDVPGTVTFTATVTLIVYGLIEASDKSWGDTATVAAFIAAAVFLAAFLLIERSRPRPIMDLALFRRPSFSTLMVGGLTLHVAAFGNLIYVSLWAQSVLGLDAVKAGLMLTPLAGLAFVTAWLAGKYLEHLGPQYLIGIGLILVSVGAFVNARITADSSWTVLMPGFCIAGVGVGFSSPVLASATLSAAPPDRAGMATGAINTFRQLGFTLAVPVFATVIAGGTEHVLSGSGLFADPSAASTELTGGRAAQLVATAPAASRTLIAHALHDAYANGLQRAFLISGVVSVLAGIAVLALVRVHTPQFQAPAPKPVKTAAADRFTLDLAAIPVVKRRSHLPVVADPSHGARVAAVDRNGEGLRTAVDKLVMCTHPTSDVMPESPIVTCDNTDTQLLIAQTTAPPQPAPPRSVPEPAAGLPAAAAALERSVRRPMAEPSTPQALQCSGRRPDGEPCKAWWVCAAHGGCAPQIKAKATRAIAERKAEKLPAGISDYEPVTDPLAELQRLAGQALRWLDVLEGIVAESQRIRYTTQAEQIDGRIVLLERAMDRAGKFLADLARLNIDERMTKLSEGQARLVNESASFPGAALSL